MSDPLVRLRVAEFRQLFFNGSQLIAGDIIEIPAENTAQWLRTGLVVPADGQYPEGVFTSPSEAPSKPAERAAHEPCDPGPKPKGKRRSVCSVPGCPCLTWGGKCRAHARTSTTTGREYHTGHRNVSANLRARWERERVAYLRANPYCECSECLAIAEPLRPSASEVDHIDGLGLLGPKAFDWDNLQSLTKAHHSRKTARESFGF